MWPLFPGHLSNKSSKGQVTWVGWTRSVIPDELALELNGIDGLQNNTGIGLRILADLQKLILCKLMQNHQGLAPDLHPPDQKKFVKLGVSKSQHFSAKMNLIFRSNSVLRQLDPNFKCCLFCYMLF